MAKRTFNYTNLSTIEIDAPKNVLDRIDHNLEAEQDNISNPDCTIKIHESKFPIEIQKDRNFKYLTIERSGTSEQPSFRYYRYNTHIRTIKQDSFNSYEVYTNTLLDEDSGLLCVRNHLSRNPKIASHPLLHASLINLNGKGMLLPGNSKQGKTTLMTYLLQEEGGVLISDENTVLDISKDKLKGLYLPKKIRVRFPTIAASRLSRALENLTLTNATQYLDADYIEKTIKNRDFEREWGLVFSRKSFCKLLEISSGESSQIDVVVFPKYQENKNVNIKSILLGEGIQRVSESGLIKKSNLYPKELEERILNPDLFKKKRLEFLEISFSGIEDLFRERVHI